MTETLRMKIKCAICNKEEELTKEEVNIMTKSIETNPEAKAIDYLEILYINRGKTCTEKDRHIFTFHEDFTKTINESVTNLKKSEEEFNTTHDKNVELKNKIETMYNELRKLTQERSDVILDENVKKDSLETHKNEFYNISGTKNIKMLM